MLLNRFINIDSIQFRNVKASKPHINDNGDFEVRLRIFESMRKSL